MVKLYSKTIMEVHMIKMIKLYQKNIHFKRSNNKFIKQQRRNILLSRAHIGHLINPRLKNKVSTYTKIQIDHVEPIDRNIK